MNFIGKMNQHSHTAVEVKDLALENFSAPSVPPSSSGCSLYSKKICKIRLDLFGSERSGGSRAQRCPGPTQDVLSPGRRPAMPSDIGYGTEHPGVLAQATRSTGRERQLLAGSAHMIRSLERQVMLSATCLAPESAPARARAHSVLL